MKAFTSFPRAVAGITLAALSLIGVHPAVADSPAMLQLDVTQSGIAGATGHRWTLHDSGQLERYSLGPGGRVTLEQAWRPNKARRQQLQQLATALCTPALPARLGAEPPVNPLTVSLSAPGCRTTLHLPGGSALDASALAPDAPAPARQLLALARLLQQTDAGR